MHARVCTRTPSSFGPCVRVRENNFGGVEGVSHIFNVPRNPTLGNCSQIVEVMILRISETLWYVPCISLKRWVIGKGTQVQNSHLDFLANFKFWAYFRRSESPPTHCFWIPLHSVGEVHWNLRYFFPPRWSCHGDYHSLEMWRKFISPLKIRRQGLRRVKNSNILQKENVNCKVKL